MSEKRSNFTGKIGFVLAAAGSAVGLGNIWRFPYLAARYGGGIFLLVYIILAVTFGFTLMCAEIAIGRKTGLSAIGAFKALDKRFAFVGWLAAIVPMIILPYYSVIGGWVVKYFGVFVSGGMEKATNDGFFGDFTSKVGEPAVYFLIFIGITVLIVLFGVEKGIEKVSKWMMPLLVLLTLFIAIYALFMDGAIKGAVYYLKPDFSRFSHKTVLAAMGQLFYSMSLAMGIMITYGSYMKKDISIEKSVKQIEIFDTGIAFLAGLMIVPAVFAFSGGNPKALDKGAGLMFVTLPKVFDTMTGGAVIGTVFFVMVFFAALTSSISLMETVVSIISDKSGWGRRKTCGIVFAGVLLLGLPSCWGYGLLSDINIGGELYFLEIFDFVSNNLIMPIVALFTSIFVGFVIKPKTLIEEMNTGGKFKSSGLFTVMIKYIAPVFIILILFFSALDALSAVIPALERFAI